MNLALTYGRIKTKIVTFSSLFMPSKFGTSPPDHNTFPEDMLLLSLANAFHR